MSETGDLFIEMQESPEYRAGWEAAERGDPRPEVVTTGVSYDAYMGQIRRHTGWADFQKQASHQTPSDR